MIRKFLVSRCKTGYWLMINSRKCSRVYVYCAGLHSYLDYLFILVCKCLYYFVFLQVFVVKIKNFALKFSVQSEVREL